ncbi:hypothetical protein CL618_03310 [archaeon]|nr:hypothetical protein [archaeon]|tara:strand:+ start:1306 stop:1596 length:291 start_codon:yes stop_codon:yes gene_type:complete
MPIKETEYGKECPIRIFELEAMGQTIIYTTDPVESCLRCNFGDQSVEKFDLEKICQCPEGMTYKEYVSLGSQYQETEGPHTKIGFRKFVEQQLVRT